MHTSAVVLIGTDVVAPADTTKYFRTDHLYQPLWDALDPTAQRKVRLANYERVFDAARLRVRAWERAQAHPKGQ
jgi:hypothetical protein